MNSDELRWTRMDADENAVLVVRLCRIDFNFDDSKWYSARSVVLRAVSQEQ